MSGPVAAIGFILLVPSILGMLFSALMFLVVNSRAGSGSGTSGSESTHPVQSAFDANFRRSCAHSANQKNLEAGYHASEQLIEQYCECALSTFKETSSETMAAQTCLQRSRDGTLGQVGQDVDALYSSPTVTPSSDRTGTDLFRVVSSGFAISLGIASFVGGLLGWLLVMKKRVLQCDVCGAVVNAS
jgi:hypothetical protein